MNARVTCVRSFTLHANDSQKYSRLVRTESKCKLIIDLSDIVQSCMGSIRCPYAQTL